MLKGRGVYSLIFGGEGAEVGMQKKSLQILDFQRLAYLDHVPQQVQTLSLL